MAQQYRAPFDFEYDWGNYDHAAFDAARTKYLADLAAMAKANGKSDLLGELVRWPRGDGYAEYMVWTTRPLALLHLDICDGWQVEDALIRGLRVADIQAMVDRERKMAALFGPAPAAPIGE